MYAAAFSPWHTPPFFNISRGWVCYFAVVSPCPFLAPQSGPFFFFFKKRENFFCKKNRGVEVSSDAEKMVPETAAVGKGTLTKMHVHKHTHILQCRFIALRRGKKHQGKSGFIWDVVAARNVPEGLKDTTTASGSPKKDFSSFVITVVINKSSYENSLRDLQCFFSPKYF